MKKRSGEAASRMGFRVASVAILFCVTLVMIGLLFLLISNKVTSESERVNSKRYQVVAVGDRPLLYFGQITDMNDDYVRLRNVFYADNSGVQQTGGTYDLIKQGCEPFGPADEMVIRRSEVVFWQNLRENSKVAKDMADYNEKHPDALVCNGTEIEL